MTHARQTLRRQLEDYAFNQAGYFSAAQAISAGYSYQAQKYHVHSGNWTRVARGLFRLPNWPPSPDDDYIRWTLWSRENGIVSHESALEVHNLSDISPAVIHISVPHTFRSTSPLVVTHYQDIEPGDIEPRQGWSVTTPLRTLADVSAADLSQEHINQALAEALERGLVTRRSILHRTAILTEPAALRLERALAHATEHNVKI